jgi:hypothetical protein
VPEPVVEASEPTDASVDTHDAVSAPPPPLLAWQDWGRAGCPTPAVIVVGTRTLDVDRYGETVCPRCDDRVAAVVAIEHLVGAGSLVRPLAAHDWAPRRTVSRDLFGLGPVPW